MTASGLADVQLEVADPDGLNEGALQLKLLVDSGTQPRAAGRIERRPVTAAGRLFGFDGCRDGLGVEDLCGVVTGGHNASVAQMRSARRLEGPGVRASALLGKD